MLIPILLSMLASPSQSATIAADNLRLPVSGPARADFESDAHRAQRRAKELTDSLRIRGRADALSARGFQAMQAGDSSAARQVYRDMTEMYPERAEGYQHLADLAMSKRDFTAAARLYSDAMERDPEAKNFYLLLRGRAFLFGGKASEALTDADEGLRLASWDSALHEIRATALLHLGRFAEAARSYQASWDMGPREWTPEDVHSCGEFKRQGYTLEVCDRPPVLARE